MVMNVSHWSLFGFCVIILISLFLFFFFFCVVGWFLVYSKEEVGSPEVPCVNPVDLNDFCYGDGKIHGYQGLKVVLLFYSYIALC